MMLHCARADAQRLRDLLRRLDLGDELEDFRHRGGQTIEDEQRFASASARRLRSISRRESTGLTYA
jgi:hypothetical protein